MVCLTILSSCSVCLELKKAGTSSLHAESTFKQPTQESNLNLQGFNPYESPIAGYSNASSISISGLTAVLYGAGGVLRLPTEGATNIWNHWNAL
jgi:hypothetical protein